MTRKKTTAAPLEPEDDGPTTYATGDDAVAAGMTLVYGTQPAADIDLFFNQTRDYIAQGKLKNGALAGSKLADYAVTNAKLGNGAVTGIKITDGTITDTKLASNSVTNAKIASGAVTAAKIADGTITGTKIANTTIPNSKLSEVAAAGVATGSKIPVYNSAGNLACNAPTSGSHTANKGYVDNALAALVERIAQLEAKLRRLEG